MGKMHRIPGKWKAIRDGPAKLPARPGDRRRMTDQAMAVMPRRKASIFKGTSLALGPVNMA